MKKLEGRQKEGLRGKARQFVPRQKAETRQRFVVPIKAKSARGGFPAKRHEKASVNRYYRLYRRWEWFLYIRQDKD